MSRRLLVFLMSFCVALVSMSQNLWPESQAEDLSGKVKKLSDYVPKEGHVLFVFWKTCCPNNITMIDELSEVYSEHDNDKYPLKIILVSVDDQQTVSRVRPIVKSSSWEFDVILDKNMDLARIYQIIMPPQWVMCDRNGKVIYCSKIMNGYLDSAIYFDELINRIKKQ